MSVGSQPSMKIGVIPKTRIFPAGRGHLPKVDLDGRSLAPPEERLRSG